MIIYKYSKMQLDELQYMKATIQPLTKLKTTVQHDHIARYM